MSLAELRQLIGHRRIVVPGVRAIIEDAGGAILLQRRSDFRLWGLPAGAVDVGESALGALTREVYEETGLTVRRAVPFGVYTDPQFNVTYPNGDEIQPFTVAFHVVAWEGTPRADGAESLSVAFFPLDELPSDGELYPVHRVTIEDFRARRGEFIVR